MTCHVCGGDQRITVVGNTALSHCRTSPEHDLGEPYLSQVLSRQSETPERDWITENDANPWIEK